VIDEKYKNGISIICIVLSIILILSVLFVTPKNEKSNEILGAKEIVLNKENITEINIEIKDEDWNWLIENASKEEYRSANVTINGETFYNVGLRPKGNSSLNTIVNDPNSDRFSLKIDFSEYIEGQTYHGYEKLALNNMTTDATYMKEYLSYEVYDYLGVPTPEFSYSNIKINDEDWGLYLAVEVIEENFIKREFGSSEGNLYKPESMEMGGNKGMGGNMGMEGRNRGNGGEGGFPPAGENWPPKQETQGTDNTDTTQKPSAKNEGSENDQPNVENEANRKSTQPGEVQNGENSKVGQQGIEQARINGQAGVNRQAENNGKPRNSGETGQQDVGQYRNNEKAGQQGVGQAENNRKGMPFGNSKGGANLKYVDDNASSYSVVKDSAIFEKTTDQDFQKVIEMVKNLNEGTNLEEYLDVEEILKYFAVNTFLVNLDSYSGGMYHNYYLYEKDGKFSIIPWDLNMSFAGFSMGMGKETSGAEKAINFPIDVPVSGNLEDAPLIGNLLKVDKYKELYHSYLEKIAEEYFNNGDFENSVTKLDKLISEYVKSDVTAFYTYDEYKKALTELSQFGKDRTFSVTSQLSGEQPSTTYGSIKTTVNLSNLGSMEMGGFKTGENGKVSKNNDQGSKAEEQSISNNVETSNNGDEASNKDGQIPKMDGQMPKVNGEMPNIDGQVPNIDGQMPNMNGKMPRMDGQMPNIDGHMSNIDGQMPNMDGQMPNIAGMPGADRTATKGNIVAYIIEGAVVFAILSVGLIFVFGYRRKKVVGK